MNKIQLCGMLLFCSNDTYFTAGSPHPPLPSLVISWNTDFLLVSKGRVGEEAKGGEVKEGE